MNKKIVVIAVVIECILAVLFVSFLGKAIETVLKDVYCSDLYFTDVEGNKIEDDSLSIELKNSNISYQLHWEVVSKKTTNKEVELISSKPDKVLVDKTGLVTFLVETDVIITVRVLDGSGKTASITLIPLSDIGGDVDI